MTRAAARRRHSSRVHRQQMKFIANWFGLRIDEDVDGPRSQSSPAPDESERKTSGEFKAVNEDVTAFAEHLLDALLGSRTMRNVREVSQSSFSVKFSAPLLVASVVGVFRATRLYQN